MFSSFNVLRQNQKLDVDTLKFSQAYGMLRQLEKANSARVHYSGLLTSQPTRVVHAS